MRTRTITCPTKAMCRRVVSTLREGGYTEGYDDSGRRVFRNAEETIYVVDPNGEDYI